MEHEAVHALSQGFLLDLEMEEAESPQKHMALHCYRLSTIQMTGIQV